MLSGYSDADWAEAQRKDPVYSRLIWLLETNRERPSSEATKEKSNLMQSLLKDWYSYDFHGGILCRIVVTVKNPFTIHDGRVQRLVPAKWRLDLWREVHKSSVCHFLYEKVYEMLMRNYTWYNMSNDIFDWGRACLSENQIWDRQRC